MDSLRRRYLQQQIELGGREIILPPGVSAPPRSHATATPPPPPARPEGPAITTGGAAEPRAWEVDAPPIPAPGHNVSTDMELDEREQLGSLADVSKAITTCQRCALHQTRNLTVPGEGNPKAGLMLVGEGPGATEDQTGRPFVGRAGELLSGILKAIGLTRDDVFIANVVKCRPPNNRKPLQEETAACLPFLSRQIALVQPKVLLALGGTAAETLLQVKTSLGKLRGAVHSFNGIPLVVTYHPAALLRNPNWKKPTWDDVRIARQLLDR